MHISETALDRMIARLARDDNAPAMRALAATPTTERARDAARPVTFIFSGGKRDAETMDAARDLLQWWMDKHAHCLTHVKVRHVAGADVHGLGPRFIGNPGRTVRKAAHRAYSYTLAQLGTVRDTQTEAPRDRRHVPGSSLPVPGVAGNKLDGSRIVVRSTLPRF